MSSRPKEKEDLALSWSKGLWIKSSLKQKATSISADYTKF
jgi:hypothetical protein